LQEKKARLQQEYASMYEHWLVRCAALDEQRPPEPIEEPLENTSETPPPQPPAQQMTRATRRTTAIHGMTARSEQDVQDIIANITDQSASDPNILCLTNLATIPDMISVTSPYTILYDDTNLRIDDPSQYFETLTRKNLDWTEEEKMTLFKTYAQHPKQFGIIADALQHRSQGECVNFYYLNKKKNVNFREIIARFAPAGKKRRGRQAKSKKKGNALLADIQAKKQKDLGVIDGDSPAPTPGRAKRATRPTTKAVSKPVSRALEVTPTASTSGTPTPTPEPEQVRAPRKRRAAAAGVSAALSRLANTEEADEEEQSSVSAIVAKPSSLSLMV
jgi:hypothetical protein